MAPTTRRYPRSLSEAFPDVRAPAVEHYARPSRALGHIAAVAAVLGCIALVGLALAARGG